MGYLQYVSFQIYPLFVLLLVFRRVCVVVLSYRVRWPFT